MPRRELTVFVLGAGKVGRGLTRALREKGVKVALRAARRGLPRRIHASLVIVAVRDRDVPPLAERLVGVVARQAAVVHVAGALDAEALAPLRGACAGVAQMHPMMSFASIAFTPSLERGNLLVRGDKVAVARARELGRRLGMVPRMISGLDPGSIFACLNALPLAKLSLSRPQRPLGSAAVTAIPAIMTLSRRSFHSSGVKFDLSVIASLLYLHLACFTFSPIQSSASPRSVR